MKFCWELSHIPKFSLMSIISLKCYAQLRHTHSINRREHSYRSSPWTQLTGPNKSLGIKNLRLQVWETPHFPHSLCVTRAISPEHNEFSWCFALDISDSKNLSHCFKITCLTIPKIVLVCYLWSFRLKKLYYSE